MNKYKLKGIWIPENILSSDLTLSEKFIFSIIKYLHQQANGCYATNEFFASYLHISKVRVSIYITSLVDKKYIKRQFILDNKLYKRILTPLL